MTYSWRWLTSSRVRALTEGVRQLKRWQNEQRDLLQAEAITQLDQVCTRALTVCRTGTDEAVQAEGKLIAAAAGQWLKPYPNSTARENVKEFLVAIVTILAFTTFFLQLTKIPTGSMQPSLYGITYDRPQEENHNRWPAFFGYWLSGVSRKTVIAPFDGYVLDIGPVQTLLPFVKRQRILFGDPQPGGRKEWLNLWSPPDDRWPQAAGIQGGKLYQRGSPIVDLRAFAGDHLLVDRFTYNFRRPARGEVVVFETKGIRGLPQDVLYIKRLVGLPGETVSIGNDQHVVIDGRRLTAGDRHFENVYTITHPGESRYSGHLNDEVARTKYGFSSPLAPLFPDASTTLKVPERGYLCLGDNTFNSLDSRAWGPVPQKNVIGKCWFVYWPFTGRFGWNTW